MIQRSAYPLLRKMRSTTHLLMSEALNCGGEGLGHAIGIGIGFGVEGQSFPDLTSSRLSFHSISLFVFFHTDQSLA